MVYTITYNCCKAKSRKASVSLDFLEVIDKLDRSLPAEAYVQGVSLASYIVTVKSTEGIENLRDIAAKATSENYSVNTITLNSATLYNMETP